jgi:hypothetical protein
MSRLFLIHVITLRSPECQSHWSLYLMVASWSLVEIPRYAFYTFAQFLETKDIPSILFNLRYSLFMILYPTGITGEMVQMLVCAKALRDSNSITDGLKLFGSTSVFTNEFSYRLISFVFIGYIAGGPYMWMNMYGQRRRATKNRNKALSPAEKDTKLLGIQWPITNELTGARSTLVSNKRIWTSAFKGLKDDEDDESQHDVEVDELLRQLDKVKNWSKLIIVCRLEIVLFVYLTCSLF